MQSGVQDIQVFSFPKQNQRNFIKIILMQFHRLNCNLYYLALRISVDTGRNQRNCNCLKPFFFCKIQRVFIAGSKKCFSFRWSIFKINRPNSMDHKTGRLQPFVSFVMSPLIILIFSILSRLGQVSYSPDSFIISHFKLQVYRFPSKSVLPFIYASYKK